MLSFEEDSDNKTLVITVNGFIEPENIEAYLHHLNRRLNDWDKIKIVKIIKKFEGIDFKSFLKVLKFYFKNLKRFEKCALITHNFLSGGQGILGTFFATIGYFSSFFLICKFKHFSFKKIEKAKIWIKDELNFNDEAA